VCEEPSVPPPRTAPPCSQLFSHTAPLQAQRAVCTLSASWLSTTTSRFHRTPPSALQRVRRALHSTVLVQQ
jgi:hypothetical protein